MFPGDIASRFIEGSIKCCNILRFFERLEHFVVLNWTNNDRSPSSVALEFNGF